jgi:hypothetical protein
MGLQISQLSAGIEQGEDLFLAVPLKNAPMVGHKFGRAF